MSAFDFCSCPHFVLLKLCRCRDVVCFEKFKVGVFGL